MSAAPVPPTYYVIAGALLAIAHGFMLQSVELALAAFIVWFTLTAQLAARRLREAWLEPVAFSEAVGTSMLQPFLAICARHFTRR